MAHSVQKVVQRCEQAREAAEAAEAEASGAASEAEEGRGCGERVGAVLGEFLSFPDLFPDTLDKAVGVGACIALPKLLMCGGGEE